MKSKTSRRKFLQESWRYRSASFSRTFYRSCFTVKKWKSILSAYDRDFSSNDKIRIAGIGMGIMGNQDIDDAIKVPGVELVAACDLYSGRLDRVKEKYGKDIFTTKDYREILNRKDIDAVVIATSDNWHSRISIDAMNAGKSVYCEKPMVHKLSQGLEVIATQRLRQKKPCRLAVSGSAALFIAKQKNFIKPGLSDN